jgi:hypothetical protein
MLSLVVYLCLRPALAVPLPNVTIKDTGVAPSVGISHGSAFALPLPPPPEEFASCCHLIFQSQCIPSCYTWRFFFLDHC